MSNLISDLDALADLLSDESRFLRNEYAADRRGHSVSTCDPAAVRWCLAGAMMNVIYKAHYSKRWGFRLDPDTAIPLNQRHDALQAALEQALSDDDALNPMRWPWETPLVRFNDHPATTHATVLDLIRRTLAQQHIH